MEIFSFSFCHFLNTSKAELKFSLKGVNVSWDSFSFWEDLTSISLALTFFLDSE
ncbi:hypothetical protein [Mycoplasma suis]|uniref:hypothetical protein n=1 Tax=Mycoplasma suis TaxID=57372 RepID=UPI0013054230|nr:hypothetical protein [Mycoplasma suis]